MDKYEALKTFIETYQPLGSWVYFNAIDTAAGNTSINTDVSPQADTVYIDGSREVSLSFAIAMIKHYDSAASDLNVEAMAEVDAFIKWLDAQNKARNFPNFGAGYIVHEVTALDSVPSLSVDNDRNLAKYQFNCAIRFLQK